MSATLRAHTLWAHTLWDWRRRVSALYADVRANPDPHAAWLHWRAGRDALFATHPQTPLDGPAAPLPFFDYDPALRFAVPLVPHDGDPVPFDAGSDGTIMMRPFARVTLGGLGSLTLFWIMGYGGGVFLPFRDATSGRETYGAGRYALDTIKGADLGSVGDAALIDLNFAYNPSCAYSPRYVCPLAPLQNRLIGSVCAGEMTPA